MLEKGLVINVKVSLGTMEKVPELENVKVSSLGNVRINGKLLVQKLI